MSKEISRRSFIKTGTAAAVGLAMAPNVIIAGEKTPKKKKKAAIVCKSASDGCQDKHKQEEKAPSRREPFCAPACVAPHTRFESI